MKYIDLHSDTLTELKEGETLVRNHKNVDLKSLKKGGCVIQCASIFIPTGTYTGVDRKEAIQTEYDRVVSVYKRELNANPKELYRVLTRRDIPDIRQNDKMQDLGTGILLTIEDGGVMGGEMQKLYRAYEDGVRLVTLTWNHENEIGYPNSTDRDIMQKGLKPFGFEVLEEMNRLGMVIDVSHLSDGGFLNVAEFAKKTGMPFVASHSNARAITPPASESFLIYISGRLRGCAVMARALEWDTQPPDGESRICDMVTHILHIRKIAGSEVLAIGSDFDGVESRMEIDSPAKMVMLYETLHQTGLSEDELEKIFYKNAQRVLTAVLR